MKPKGWKGARTMSEPTNNKRFRKTLTEGIVTTSEIWVDTQTGVNYLFHQSGYAGGLTPLLDKDGKPVVTPVTPSDD